MTNSIEQRLSDVVERHHGEDPMLATYVTLATRRSKVSAPDRDIKELLRAYLSTVDETRWGSFHDEITRIVKEGVGLGRCEKRVRMPGSTFGRFRQCMNTAVTEEDGLKLCKSHSSAGESSRQDKREDTQKKNSKLAAAMYIAKLARKNKPNDETMNEMNGRQKRIVESGGALKREVLSFVREFDLVKEGAAYTNAEVTALKLLGHYLQKKPRGDEELKTIDHDKLPQPQRDALADLPTVSMNTYKFPYNADVFATDGPSVVVVKLANGDRYFVDTAGYTYPRYVAKLVTSSAAIVNEEITGQWNVEGVQEKTMVASVQIWIEHIKKASNGELSDMEAWDQLRGMVHDGIRKLRAGMTPRKPGPSLGT